MNFAPYQWRANQGYLPPPGSVPMPVAPVPLFYPYSQQPIVYGQQIAYGPVRIGVVAAQPPTPPASSKTSSKKEDIKGDEKGDKKDKPKLPSSSPPSSAPSKKSDKSDKESDKDDKKKGDDKEKPSDDAKSVALSLATKHYAAPSLRPGINYMYPAKASHTILHVFSKAAPIWEDKYKGQNLNFKIFKVATSMSVGTIVERVLGKEGDDCKGWAVTEVIEGGEGGWIKGTTIPYGSDKAKGTLDSMGWNSKRGGTMDPVWIVVLKV